jgi:hypothetical protein
MLKELIIRLRARKVKEAFNELIQDIWDLFPTRLANKTYFPIYMPIEFILPNA